MIQYSMSLEPEIQELFARRRWVSRRNPAFYFDVFEHVTMCLLDQKEGGVALKRGLQEGILYTPLTPPVEVTRNVRVFTEQIQMLKYSKSRAVTRELSITNFEMSSVETHFSVTISSFWKSQLRVEVEMLEHVKQMLDS